jgi:DNA (cytosine-5)-methyltransferase 1
MTALTVGSLFSGIGGLDLGLERAGCRVLWQSEIDPYASQVLAKHWPTVPNLGDITTIDWTTVERPDLICGGYPCQPFSQAGRRRGADDPRHLWPYMLDALRELRPRYALMENVSEHLRLGFDAVLADLASIGFDAEWSVVSACSVGAPHRRRRLFVLAYPQGDDGPGEGPRDRRSYSLGGLEPRGSGGSPRSDWWLSEPSVDRVAHGVPRRLVEPALRAVGNSVVPQVAELIGRRIVTCGAPVPSIYPEGES